ncbi:translation elongation factor Ts [Desulfovermiculus halophilus]|jgi:elongation factor Ts|uniref:translation elongation factor Ts n=1 Tax=Desulfovermiculus halophilus TaxID=339722 RepID=UPI0004800A4E|nr:translation elongation factor Ts [Desulfovermiculus halophilus]
MEITAKMVKELREKTGAGMMDCKKALQESDGDEQKAVSWLREKGLSKAQKRAGRSASEGFIGSYVHANGKIGVLVELNCETDFVAKSDKFQELAKNLSMQIAAANPVCVRPEDLPQEYIEQEKEIYAKQARADGKPEHVVEKIVEGRVNKYYKEVCLLEQPYIKDDSIAVKDLINELVAVLGEKVEVNRFVRMEVGETHSEE